MASARVEDIYGPSDEGSPEAEAPSVGLLGGEVSEWGVAVMIYGMLDPRPRPSQRPVQLLGPVNRPVDENVGGGWGKPLNKGHRG
eukprot:11584071-Alexandrium_andersonii.AAC.1